MKQNNNILENKHLRENPYKAPVGYFSQLEDEVNAKIHGEASISSRIWIKSKSIVVLACSFILLWGLGYGIFNVANLGNQAVTTESGLLALIDEGYLSNSFIEDYYDEINLSEYVSDFEENDELDNNTINEIEESMTSNEILEYLYNE